MSAATADNFFADHAKYLVAALVLHVVVVVLLTVTINSNRQVVVPAQLAIKATIVDNSAKRIKREKEQAEAERVERERVAAEKKEAEEAEARKEEERQAKQVEEKRQQQLVADKKQKAEVERVALAKKKATDDQKRAADIKTKQADKQKAEREAREQAQREAELKRQVADEEGVMNAKNSGALNEYMVLVKQKIERNWTYPDSARAGIVCTLMIRQTASGYVLNVEIEKCNGNDALKQSVIAAVHKASPLPLPSDMRLFSPKITFNFRPEE